MERIAHLGWPNCIRLANSDIEIIITTDVGPRIIHAGFIGSQNFMKVFDAQAGQTGGGEWHPYGGHRFWHAPESIPRTYSPDNVPVEWQWDAAAGDGAGALTLRQSVEPSTGIQKSWRMSLDPARPVVCLAHTLTNRSPWSVELAPWVLTVLAPGGRAIIPQEEFRPHPDYLLPARLVVLWHYTDMSDPRWTWGRRYIQLRQDLSRPTKQKIGVLNKQGWAACVMGAEALVKRIAPFDPAAAYPDMGCNVETFTNDEILELETLGPLVRLEPGASTTLSESWLFARGLACDFSDDGLDAALLPLAQTLQH